MKTHLAGMKSSLSVCDCGHKERGLRTGEGKGLLAMKVLLAKGLWGTLGGGKGLPLTLLPPPTVHQPPPRPSPGDQMSYKGSPSSGEARDE